MFVLTVIEDKIKMTPDQFDQDRGDVLLQQIEMKFCNKILADVGLCICFYDFIEIGDPYVYPAEGSAHQKVKFRLVVFRPFIGEVVVGKICSCREDGIRVSLEFFEDILIPTYLLQAPSEFNAAARQWVWKFGAEEGVDGEEGVTEFVMQQGDEIRFRVRTIHFTRVTSTAKGMVATTTSETSHSASGSTHSGPAGSSGDSEVTGGQHDMPAPQVHRRRSTSFDIDKEQNAPSAMQVVGCINEDGLGLTSWWGEYIMVPRIE